MRFIKAFFIWLIILVLAVINGGIRDYVTAPLLGSNIALPLSGIILSVLIFVMTYLLIPKIGKAKSIDYILIGVMWSVLANIFDFSFTVIGGNPISIFFSMFDITTGNLWCVVVITCFVSPIIAAKIRKLNVDFANHTT